MDQDHIAYLVFALVFTMLGLYLLIDTLMQLRNDWLDWRDEQAWQLERERRQHWDVGDYEWP